MFSETTRLWIAIADLIFRTILGILIIYYASGSAEQRLVHVGIAMILMGQRSSIMD